MLPALVYRSSTQSKVLAIYIHGAGSSSILNNPSLTNLLADRLISAGVDLLMFNNRGAGYITKLHLTTEKIVSKSQQLGGMAYERISDSVKDINGAIAWARLNGYRSFYLIGHSTGANKLCYYLSSREYDKKITRAYLVSGGDDVGLQINRLDDCKRTRSIVNRAIKKGRGQELVPTKLFPGEHPISYNSFKELITEGSDYDMFPFSRYNGSIKGQAIFKNFRTIKIPLTIIYGQNDFGTIVAPGRAMETLASIKPNAEYYIIPKADHNFTGYEKQLVSRILQSL